MKHSSHHERWFPATYPVRLAPFALLRALAIVLGLLGSHRALIAQVPEAPLTMPQMPLHDPYLLPNSSDRTYYLYTSNQPEISGVPGTGTMVYRSRDLRHWQKPVVVFTVPPEAFGHQGAWAPEVHQVHGRYYLFTTLYNDGEVLAAPPKVPLKTIRRGTVVAISDSPLGPFRMPHPEAPVAPRDFMTLDGTLFTDRDGQPWMVYAHEWLQKLDGTMEAVPLTPDLSRAAGPPVFLFKASDAPWLDAALHPGTEPLTYVTDGPELYRTRDGHLLMLWSSYNNGSYVQTVARSASGDLRGPWQQLAPLVEQDSGHGMLFRAFDGRLMLILHHPFRHARGRLFDVRDAGDHLVVERERLELDGAVSSLLQQAH